MDGGIIPLWKERGVYSQRYITKIRKLLAIKKVGHSGTLDPDVDGVLPIAFGVGTKVLEYMLEADKTYQAEVTLGYATTSEDASGEVTERSSVAEGQVQEDELDAVLEGLVGPLDQIPPMVSAVRVDGQRLYDLARQGKEVERPSRRVKIYHLKRTSCITYQPDEETASFTFDVSCSKGTYIRTLAVEIGRRLNLPAHLSQLTRIESGGIEAQECLTMEALIEAKEAGKLSDYVLPLERFLSDFPQIDVTEDVKTRIFHGALLSQENFKDQDVSFPALLSYQGQALALYGTHPDRSGWLKPKKMIRTRLEGEG